MHDDPVDFRMTRLGLHPTAYGNRASFGQEPVRKSRRVFFSLRPQAYTRNVSLDSNNALGVVAAFPWNTEREMVSGPL